MLNDLKSNNETLNINTVTSYIDALEKLYVIEDLHTSKIPTFFDSNPETTTLELLKNLKEKKQYFNNYIEKNEYRDIFLEIQDVFIFENKIVGSDKTYIIAFIIKK